VSDLGKAEERIIVQGQHLPARARNDAWAKNGHTCNKIMAYSQYQEAKTRLAICWLNRSFFAAARACYSQLGPAHVFWPK
jgi:hypothetical protein